MALRILGAAQAGLQDAGAKQVELGAATLRDAPSPITRTGPGASNAIRPDLCDYGGTAVYDGGVGRILTGRDWISAGMATGRGARPCCNSMKPQLK